MLATTRKTVFATALAASTPGLGIAQELSTRTGGDQFKSLSDAYWKARSDLRMAGVDLKLSNTNFYQGLAAGTGGHSFEFGGKFEALATFDLSRFGFWSGFSLTTKFEHNYGESANGRGGTLLPVNTALAFPGLGNHQGSDLSTFYLTQKFNDMFSLSVGKFNMIDKVAATPLRGGGNDTFMNVGLAAPVTGLTPPYIFGAIATIKTGLRSEKRCPQKRVRRSVQDRRHVSGLGDRARQTVRLDRLSRLQGYHQHEKRH
jgi:porin